ncbi:hypothetical protein G6O69_33010 [Pseudenhygromyxa sp. WMMC2535]|uniref:hypothetical protein n=1 Tax=Pseudenhygromyxa sp. WMMC2535 TaxID=2712867 RepID=UPI001555453B|nr:hypothetical protein [Pseudenhygromyxa sp. WMMC2535]NVB42689.1 hypothetical protein [Pseudenhygromyxa sp. WMMC2535]
MTDTQQRTRAKVRGLALVSSLLALAWPAACVDHDRPSAPDSTKDDLPPDPAPADNGWYVIAALPEGLALPPEAHAPLDRDASDDANIARLRDTAAQRRAFLSSAIARKLLLALERARERPNFSPPCHMKQSAKQSTSAESWARANEVGRLYALDRGLRGEPSKALDMLCDLIRMNRESLERSCTATDTLDATDGLADALFAAQLVLALPLPEYERPSGRLHGLLDELTAEVDATDERPQLGRLGLLSPSDTQRLDDSSADMLAARQRVSARLRQRAASGALLAVEPEPASPADSAP